MSSKRILLIAAFIVLLVPVLLTLCGCPLHIDSLYGLKVAADGSGGAIVIYEDSLGGNIYSQKISPEGNLLWGEKGVLLGSINSKTYSFFNFNIVSDNSGGAIVVWPDSSQNQFRPTSHLARISSEGKILWQNGFISFNQMVSDGSGGALIAFDFSAGEIVPGDTGNSVTVVKIDSQGNYPWGIQGVTIPRQGYRDNTLQLVSDGSGGAIVSWEEVEIPAITTPGVANQNTYRLVAQRIDSQGKLSWGDNVLLYVAANGTRFEGPRTVNDGTGGIIVSWLQVTEVPADSNGLRSQKMDIGLQKVDSNGQVLWQPDGVQLGATGTVTDSSVLIGDNSGGAILIWRDRRQATANAMHIYAQRVNTDGNAAWQAGGVDVSATSLNPGSQAAGDGSGGAIISYAFQEDEQKLHIQKLDNRGLTVWTPNGISVTDAGFASQAIAADGQGGAIVAWGVGKGIFSSEKAFIQRVNTNGQLMWGEKGIRLNP